MDAYRNAAEFAELTTVGVTPRKVARVKHARGMRLRVETGCVWITQDHCRDDVCLKAGESYCIPHDGLTVILALDCPLALVSIEPSVAAARAERSAAIHRLLVAPLARLWKHD